MSKLAHSNQATMDEIERRHWEEQGEQVTQCRQCGEWLIVGMEPEGCRDPHCPMFEHHTGDLLGGDET